jgi:hypothetical protein
LEYPGNEDLAIGTVVSLGTWFLALMNFVAISLMVTLELIKFFQAYFIQEDWRMFDQEKGMAASVQTSNLNEELGMVHYIFSDKTECDGVQDVLRRFSQLRRERPQAEAVP